MRRYRPARCHRHSTLSGQASSIKGLTRFRVVKPFPFYGRYLGSGEHLYLPPSEAESWLASGHIIEADAPPEDPQPAQ